MVTSISVLIVDSDPLAARGLRAALAGAGDVDVLATVADVRSAAALVEQYAPDVVVIDGSVSGERDIDSLFEPSSPGRRPAVLVLARSDDAELGVRALRHGAAGYLAKGTSVDALPRIVRALAAGQAVLSRDMATTIVRKLRELPEFGSGLRPVRSPLSTREWEVLDLLCAGASTRQIADDLGLTVETVRSHVKRVLRKLDAHTRAEAVDRARGMMSASRTVTGRRTHG